MPQNKDSIQNTFLVAGTLCLVCAALVSIAAVSLKPIKLKNILLDKRTNILKVCGFSQEEIDEAGGVNALFEERFETFIIDLDSGSESLEGAKEAAGEAGKNFGKTPDDFINDYDQMWCSKSKKTPVADEVPKKEDICGIKFREKFSHVFLMKSETGEIQKYVFPVRSYGLWSMMQGYLAVEPDLQTVAGLTFYDQKETPGLGGEVTKEYWKEKWVGKKIFADDGKVVLRVAKALPDDDPNGVDAISGATITSNGVTNLVKYWMGDRGFGPFIEKQKSGNGISVGSSSGKSASVQPPAKSGVNHG